MMPAGVWVKTNDPERTGGVNGNLSRCYSYSLTEERHGKAAGMTPDTGARHRCYHARGGLTE